MHGWVQRKGERNCRSPQRSIGWHMHPTVIAGDSNSFVKVGIFTFFFFICSLPPSHCLGVLILPINFCEIVDGMTVGDFI